MLMASNIWLLYSHPIVKRDNSVFFIHSLGFCAAMYYLKAYFVLVKDREEKVIVAVAMLCLHSRRALFMRIVADVFDIIMYVSPLTIWKKVVTTRSVEYMPFWLSLAVFCNGIYGTIYALVQFDIFILVSNGVGAIFGAIQLGLYAYFYVNGEDRTKDQVEKTSEVTLSVLPVGAA
ncbi:hypothetical protein V6N13_088277 [Hibiscus sabdariffa]|uniref:Uncharacterized protein n=1 Tax=Hibiscus sabdariffa TaxID=183260 RepID=A0ABR2FYU1_9ROSI